MNIWLQMEDRSVRLSKLVRGRELEEASMELVGPKTDQAERRFGEEEEMEGM